MNRIEYFLISKKIPEDLKEDISIFVANTNLTVKQQDALFFYMNEVFMEGSGEAAKMREEMTEHFKKKREELHD